MQIKIISPTKAYVLNASSLEIESLRKSLSYVNTANQHSLKRHYTNVWFKNKNRKGWEAQLEILKSEVNQCLLFQDEYGYYIRPGSISYLDIPDSSITNEIQYPIPKKVAWAQVPKYTLYPYQKDSVEKLIAIKHGNVELATGSGKSNCIMNICRETGFNTAIVAPSASIFNELLEKFEHYFGKGNVGAFGDGKKRLGKKFTVCIGDSLCNLKQNTPEWDFFSKIQMILIDESHLWGSETLEKVCHDIFSEVPYRLFFSGTQTRNDGGEKLLQSIVGPTVHSLSTAEAVNGGYICDHDFKIVEIESSNPNMNSNDILEQKRIHILRNKNIANFIARFANAKSIITGEQTLVLVEELSQIALLLPLLKVPFAYAHSESSKIKLAELEASTGVLLEKVDSSESVENFNKNNVKVLIGTSCISTGTNIYPTHNVFNWQAGASSIKTKQGAVGRAVRLHKANPWADKCVMKHKATIWDFDVKGIETLKRHLLERIESYKDSGTEIKFIRLK